MGKGTLIRECFHLHDSTHRCRRYKIKYTVLWLLGRSVEQHRCFRDVIYYFFALKSIFLYINKGVAKDAIVKGLYIQCPGVKKSHRSGSFSHFTSSFEPQRGVRLNINVNANLIRFIVRTQFKTNSISISCSWTISYVKQRDRTQTKGCDFFVQNFFLAIMHALLIYIDWRRIRIFNYNSLCVVNFQCLI